MQVSITLIKKCSLLKVSRIRKLIRSVPTNRYLIHLEKISTAFSWFYINYFLTYFSAVKSISIGNTVLLKATQIVMWGDYCK